jgi:putative MATE family efflux protein
MAERTGERASPRSASDDVEADVGGLPDPEGGPQNPAGSLAMGALLSPRERRSRTRGEILRLAWPVMLSMLLASIVGAVDVLMVKRLGAFAQAAVGVGAQVFMLAQAVLFALSFACVALMARAIGAGQHDRARHALAGALILALVTSLLLFLVFGIDPGWILALIGIEPAVAAATSIYLRLVMAASILMGLSLTVESALRANRDTVTPMLVTVVVTIAKIGLNPLLIFGAGGVIPPLGLAGAGWATLGAQAVALVAFAWVTLRAPADGPLGVRVRDLRPARAMIAPLIRVSLPGVGERLILQVAMLTYLTAVGSFGTYATAAYSIGVRLLSFSWIPGNGFSQAAATIVGQALGAGDLKKAERAAKRSASLAVSVAVGMGAIAYFADRPIAEFSAADPHTAEALIPFMMCLALAQPFMQLHFTLAGAFRGAGDTWTPLVSALIGNWAFRVPFAWLVTKVLHAELFWVWAVLMLDHVARAIWLLWAFRRRDWSQRLGGIPTSG